MQNTTLALPETQTEKLQEALDLAQSGIYPLPVHRNPDTGVVTHPESYAEFRNNPTKESLIDFYHQYPRFNGRAVVAGFSGFCCIDFDLKNTQDKDLFTRWVAMIYPEILERCYIERTRSGGYHVFFFCPEFRYDAKPASNEQGRAVIEFFCRANKIIYTYPTPGYTEVQNSLADAGTLTKEEALILLQTAELFNLYRGKQKTYHTAGTGKRLEYPAEVRSFFQDFDLRVNPDELMDYFCKQTGWRCEYNARKNEFELWHPFTTVKARSAVFFPVSMRMIVFSESQQLFPSWCSFDESKPTPYIVSPTHILYALADQDFAEVERLARKLMPPKISVKVKRWLLTYIDAEYIRATVTLLGQKKICGKENYTIKVDSYLLVYLMHLIDPQYTWTCEGYHDEYFSAETCKEVIPDDAIISHAFGTSIFIDRQYRYPLIFDGK